MKFNGAQACYLVLILCVSTVQGVDANEAYEARVVAMEAEVEAVERRLSTRVQELENQMRIFAVALGAHADAFEGTIKDARATTAGAASATVDAAGNLQTRRGLAHGNGEPGAGSSHFVAVDAKQVHEFPIGGSCSTAAQQAGPDTKLLSKARADNTLAYTSSQSDASSDLSLVTVTDRSTSPWTTTTIQTMAAPFKVVHDANCASSPSLELPLNTNVAGTLTVNSIDIGAKLSGTWTDITLSNQVQAVVGLTPQYLVRDGVVYLRGAITRVGGGDFQYNDWIATLPVETRPSQWSTFVLASRVTQGSTIVRAYVGDVASQYAGYFQLKDAASQYPNEVDLTTYYYL